MTRIKRIFTDPISRISVIRVLYIQDIASYLNKIFYEKNNDKINYLKAYFALFLYLL